jgi:20S proteasome subunit alpha 7
MCRPYGVSSLLAVHDKAAGPQLYLVEPSGIAHRYYGTAVGKGRQSVKTEIERLKFDQITCRQAVVECAKT